MIIREAEEKDALQVMDILNDSILNSIANLDIPIKTLTDTQAFIHNHRDIHRMIVAAEDQAVLGFACFSPLYEKAAYAASVEISIYIHKDHRKIGLGRRLMRELMTFGQKHPQIHTVISKVTNTNEASKRLLDHFGFSYVGTLHEAAVKFDQLIDVDIFQYIYPR